MIRPIESELTRDMETSNALPTYRLFDSDANFLHSEIPISIKQQHETGHEMSSAPIANIKSYLSCEYKHDSMEHAYPCKTRKKASAPIDIPKPNTIGPDGVPLPPRGFKPEELWGSCRGAKKV